MRFIVLLFAFYSLSFAATAQTAKDAKRVVGNWVFTDTKGSRKSTNIRIRIDRDSLVITEEDDYGAYRSEDAVRFPAMPKRSGRKGMSFEVETIEVDEDGDSVGIGRFISFVGLQQEKVEVSTGTVYRLLTSKPIEGDQSGWYDKLRRVMGRMSSRAFLARRVK